MKIIYNILLITCLTSFFINVYSQTLVASLEKAAKNRHELEKTLKYFKDSGDSEKHQAAKFLIENMTFNHGIHCNWFDQNGKDLQFNEMKFADFQEASKEIESMLDNETIQPKQLKFPDVNLIKAELLIENIEYAFKVWRENPWSKNYDFNVFCEYILPYRNVSEPLQSWRKIYLSKNNELIKEVAEINDPILILGELMKQMQNYDFIFNRKEPLPVLGAQQVLFRKQGTCIDYASFALYNARSVGLATSFDFTPHYAASSNRHFWNTIVDKDGIHVPFDGYDYAKGIDPLNKRIAKVMRRTYSIQKNSLALLFKENDIPYGFLRDVNTIDVTDEYMSTTDIPYTFSSTQKINYGLINVFNLSKWQPIFWSDINEERQATFKNMGRDIVYLVSNFANNKNNYERFPILVNNIGHITILDPSAKGKIQQCRLSKDNEVKRDNIDYNPFDIVSGEPYDLLTWDNGWVKIRETQIAKEDALHYKGLPENALYLLLPINDIDGFERPFMINPINQQINWY